MRRHPLRHARRAYFSLPCSSPRSLPHPSQEALDRWPPPPPRPGSSALTRSMPAPEPRSPTAPALPTRARSRARPGRRRQDRQRPVVRRRQRLGHDRRHGLARLHQRHDPRSLGEADRAGRDLAHRRLKERGGNNLVYGLYSNTEQRPPDRHRDDRLERITAHRQRQRSASRRGVDAPRHDLRWRHAAPLFNGTQVGSLAVTGAMANSSGALRIGGNAVWAEWFSGQIDDLRIYNRALTVAELQSDMNTPVGGTPPPPPDTQAPTAPAGLTASGQTQTQITLSWTASSDNVGVTGYSRYQNGTLISSATGTSFTFTASPAGRATRSPSTPSTLPATAQHGRLSRRRLRPAPPRRRSPPTPSTPPPARASRTIPAAATPARSQVRHGRAPVSPAVHSPSTASTTSSPSPTTRRSTSRPE